VPRCGHASEMARGLPLSRTFAPWRVHAMERDTYPSVCSERVESASRDSHSVQYVSPAWHVLSVGCALASVCE
jgi:hypothetical protein